METLEILKKIDDLGVFVELKTKDGESLGIYNKNDPFIVYNYINNIKNKSILNMNAQYLKGKKLLVLTLKD